jgi:hypothetical protein
VSQRPDQNAAPPPADPPTPGPGPTRKRATFAELLAELERMTQGWAGLAGLGA